MKWHTNWPMGRARRPTPQPLQPEFSLSKLPLSTQNLAYPSSFALVRRVRRRRGRPESL